MVEAKYRQIADELRGQIEEGVLQPGDKLTEKELAVRFDVSINTVKEALRELKRGGLVSTQPKVGTIIAKPVKPLTSTLSHVDLAGKGAVGKGFGGGEGEAWVLEAALQGRMATVGPLTVEMKKANKRLAEKLDTAVGAQLVARTQFRYIDDVPNSIQTSYFSLKLAMEKAPLLLEAEDIKDGTVVYLHDRGREQAWYEDEMTARQPTPDELDFFGLSKDSLAVLEVIRTAYDQNDVPFRLTVTVSAPGRNVFRILGGDVPAQVRELEEHDSGSSGEGKTAG
ncbi:GntR family transcriptional regulator [Actinomadura scrupuli]|uniref:GntR family transcriptional regulator n=1 Tax=Actinomadura scrupuli TaxID=559629 RepID=UPI003D973CD9